MRLPLRRRSTPGSAGLGSDRASLDSAGAGAGAGAGLGHDRAGPDVSELLTAGAGRTAMPGDHDVGHALRAPSRLHAFNRYEIKYLVPAADVPALRDEFVTRMDRDSHGGERGYGVWSVYYDTAQLRFYWEKIEGLRFRRKLRVRHYGDRFSIDDDTPVHVEIKQRVNRVTQKRRVALPYRLARDLCDRRELVRHSPDQRAFLEEVLELVSGLDLRPVAMTGYQREAFLGRGADVGLRVTLDHRVRGRDRDFHLGADAENRLIVPAKLSVLEIKANERIPYWLADLAARANLSVVRMSKYCQCVEAFGRAPRSVFHVADDDPATDPASEPVTRLATGPATGPASASATGPASASAAELAAGPVSGGSIRPASHHPGEEV